MVLGLHGSWRGRDCTTPKETARTELKEGSQLKEVKDPSHLHHVSPEPQDYQSEGSLEQNEKTVDK